MWPPQRRVTSEIIVAPPRTRLRQLAHSLLSNSHWDDPLHPPEPSTCWRLYLCIQSPGDTAPCSDGDMRGPAQAFLILCSRVVRVQHSLLAAALTSTRMLVWMSALITNEHCGDPNKQRHVHPRQGSAYPPPRPQHTAAHGWRPPPHTHSAKPRTGADPCFTAAHSLQCLLPRVAKGRAAWAPSRARHCGRDKLRVPVREHACRKQRPLVTGHRGRRSSEHTHTPSPSPMTLARVRHRIPSVLTAP